MEGLTRVVGSFLAVIGGTMAIKAFISDFIDTNAQLDRLSKNLGLSVSTISAWSQATERFGGSASALQGTMSMLSREQTNLLLTGESNLIPYFSMLGLALADANGNALTSTAIFDELNKALNDRMDTGQIDRPTANNLLARMGIDQGTANLILQTRKEFELMQAVMKKYAATKEQTAEAAKLQFQIFSLKQQFMAFGRTLLMDAAPALEKLLGMFAYFGDWVQSHKQFVEDFLKTIAVGLTALSVALFAISWQPFTLGVVAVLALGAAIALLWDDYQTWKKGGDSLIDWGKWEPGITAATAALKLLGDAILGDLMLIKKLHDLAPDWAKKIFGAAAEGPLGMFGEWSKAGGANDSRNRNLPIAQAIATQEGFYAKGKTPNVAQRNNNPGNIKYGDFAKRHGATGTDGTFAIFPDVGTGRAALDALLASPAYAGLSTDQIIQKYAPPSENDTGAYIAAVKKMTGNGDYLSMMNGIPGASAMAANAPQGSQATGNVDKSVQVTIQQMDLHTQATDAAGIAADFGSALDYQLAAQANSGQN
jgi:hypothetical protein